MIQLILWVFPWRIRRLLLNRIFAFQIDSSARIGFSLINVKRLEMGPSSRIGHLNVAKGVSLIFLGEQALIGHLNWITGFPQGRDDFFGHLPDRVPFLRIGRHSAVTSRHMLDCTGGVDIGEFVTVGGWYSQIISHSFDFDVPRQDAGTIRIGDYSFIGSRSILLMGAQFPQKSILSAGSTFGTREGAQPGLYSGVPAAHIRDLNPSKGYFVRARGLIT